jgi:ATP-dependent DNA helicase RecG
MEIAVQEMHKSRSEHKEKSDPLVGAVLVARDGQQLGTTCRGDLRVGHHAEFTLIERYLQDRNLEDATLYVTLEPCIKRTPPKKPCVEHIVAARISRVFVGLTDPNPDVSGRGIQSLLDHGIEVDFFDLDLIAQVKEANRDFIEFWHAPKKEVESQGDYEGAAATELTVQTHVGLDALSSEAILKYVRARRMTITIPSDEVWKTFEAARFIGRTLDGELAPTTAGIVLFATNATDILPQCRVSLEARKGSRSTQSDYFGPLVLFREYIDDFLQREMRYFTEIRGLERLRNPEYPLVAVRETIFNALAHRDYREGARVHVSFTDDALVVRSPGTLLKPISLARMRQFNAPQYSRNPHIAVVMYHLGYIEERGSGLARMRDAMVKHGLEPPLFSVEDGYFVVSLRGTGRKTEKDERDKLDLMLNEMETKLVNLLRKRGQLAASECAANLKVDVTTARRYLRNLMSRGIVVQSGTGPKTKYRIADR